MSLAVAMPSRVSTGACALDDAGDVLLSKEDEEQFDALERPARILSSSAVILVTMCVRSTPVKTLNSIISRKLKIEAISDQ